jgi:hypothetical protein
MRTLRSSWERLRPDYHTLILGAIILLVLVGSLIDLVSSRVHHHGHHRDVLAHWW